MRIGSRTARTIRHLADAPNRLLGGQAGGGVETVDAVVIGGGHHGLVAAAYLADAGWDVVVLEERERVGGAVDSREVDGWVLDSFSACHPLALASPVLQALELEDHGLRWSHARTQLAHVSRSGTGPTPAVFRDAASTAALLAEDDPRDGRTWSHLVEQYADIKGPLLDAILTRWPPVAEAARLAHAVGVAELPDFLRFALLPTTRMGEELFHGRAGRELMAGNAMHADAPPTAAVSGMYGWLMTMLAQDVGFPSPQGGTRELANALRRRAEAAGARVETGVSVTRVAVRGGRAHGVETNDGRRLHVRCAVVADTSAPMLYERLLDDRDVPPGLRARLRTFEWDLPTVKLNYRLAEPVPWSAPEARGAGVVHAGRDVPGLVQWSAELEAGLVPERPFALIGQMSSIDPTRSPDGTETMWLYTHLPRGCTDPEAAQTLTRHSEEMLDEFAPDWRDLVIDRWVQTPQGLEADNANLGDGGVGGGTQQLLQQAIWRPVAGLGGPWTHIRGLYLGSAAIHPGGGVHGGCGYLAARAALADAGAAGALVSRVRTSALRRFHDRPHPAWTARV